MLLLAAEVEYDNSEKCVEFFCKDVFFWRVCALECIFGVFVH